MPPEISSLPRLLYAGDVPVEASSGGSLLLHRLLLNYPADRLSIWESNLQVSRPERRLAIVAYESFPVGWARLLRTRGRGLYSTWLVATIGLRSARLIRAARAFGAEAILTVSHGYGWLAAAAAARALDLPLHLIAHDDWPSMTAFPPALRPWAERRFGRVYRQAVSRLCVSPAMQRQYQRDHEAVGEVLYPSRGPAADSVKPYREKGAEGVVFGYAGSIFNPEYLRCLSMMADLLRPFNGRVRIHSPSLDRSPAGLPINLEVCKPLMPSQVIPELTATCDALVVPMAFGAQDAANMRICFPSKLADYTATGLPLLIWGPSYSSANVWAHEEGGGWAEVVESPDISAAAGAVRRLATDPAHRGRLGGRAHARGERCFSWQAAVEQFQAALTRTR